MNRPRVGWMLGWVRHTVAAFGSDLDNVTVFGQSAGATLIGPLLATPEACSGAHHPKRQRSVLLTIVAESRRRVDV